MKPAKHILKVSWKCKKKTQKLQWKGYFHSGVALKTSFTLSLFGDTSCLILLCVCVCMCLCVLAFQENTPYTGSLLSSVNETKLMHICKINLPRLKAWKIFVFFFHFLQTYLLCRKKKKKKLQLILKNFQEVFEQPWLLKTHLGCTYDLILFST